MHHQSPTYLPIIYRFSIIEREQTTRRRRRRRRRTTKSDQGVACLLVFSMYSACWTFDLIDDQSFILPPSLHHHMTNSRSVHVRRQISSLLLHTRSLLLPPDGVWLKYFVTGFDMRCSLRWCSICGKYAHSTSGVGKEGRWKVRRAAASNPLLERGYVPDRDAYCAYEFETRLVARARAHTHGCE